MFNMDGSDVTGKQQEGSTEEVDQQLDQETSQNVEEQQNGEDKPLTRAEFDLAMQQINVNMQKAISSAVQSFTDKGVNNIVKTVQKRLEGLRENQKTLNLSDEQLTEAADKIFREELSKVQAPEGKQQGQQDRQMNSPDQPAPILSEIADTFVEEGIAIERTDPEFPTLRAALMDPNGSDVKTRKVLFQVIEAKRTRLAASREQSKARGTTGVKGKVSSKKDISKVNDSGELYKMEEQRMTGTNNLT